MLEQEISSAIRYIKVAAGGPQANHANMRAHRQEYTAKRAGQPRAADIQRGGEIFPVNAGAGLPRKRWIKQRGRTRRPLICWRLRAANFSQVVAVNL